MSTATKPLADLFRLCLLAEKPGIVGGPVFHLSLLIDPTRSLVPGGVVEITQAVTPPNGNIRVNVKGTYHELVFGGKVTRVINISGEYLAYCTPPALCVYEQKFSAHLVLDDKFDGTGTFHWGNNTDANVPVKNLKC